MQCLIERPLLPSSESSRLDRDFLPAMLSDFRATLERLAHSHEAWTESVPVELLVDIKLRWPDPDRKVSQTELVSRLRTFSVPDADPCPSGFDSARTYRGLLPYVPDMYAFVNQIPIALTPHEVQSALDAVVSCLSESQASDSIYRPMNVEEFISCLTRHRQLHRALQGRLPVQQLINVICQYDPSTRLIPHTYDCQASWGSWNSWDSRVSRPPRAPRELM